MIHVHSLFESVSRWSLTVLAALIPLFIVPTIDTTVPQAKLLFLSGLVLFAAASWIIAAFFAREIRIPRHVLLASVVLLPAAYAVSAFIAGWPMSAVVSGLAEQDTVVAATLLAAAFFLTAVTHREGTITHFIRAFMVGGAVLVVTHVARLFAPEMLSFGGVLVNTTASLAGTWHDLGIMLGLFTIIGGFLCTTPLAGSTLWRVFFGVVAAASFAFLIVVSLQDIWFVLAGILGLFGVYSWFSHSRDVPEHSALLARSALWIVVAISAFLLGWFNVWVHDHLPANIQIVAVEVRPSWEGTLSVGQSSLTNSRALIFGTGPNTFARNWAQFKPQGVNETLFWNLDFNNGVGAVPTSFVTIGALGIAAWLIIVLTFLVTAGNALRREKLFGTTQTITFGLVCAVLYLLAFHVMYAPGLTISVLFFVFLGLFVVQTNTKRVQFSTTLDTTTSVIGVIVAALLVFGTLGVGTVSAYALLSDIYVNKSVALYQRDGNVGTASEEISHALQLWPANDRAHRAAVELGILELSQLSAKANTDETARKQLQDTLSQTIEHGLKAVSIDREDYQNWFTVAQLYQELAGVGIEGAYEQAQQAYESAREENPTNPMPLLRLAQLEVVRGNTSNAIDLFGEAVNVKRDFAPAYFLRSQLLAQQNRLDDAVASAAAAVQLVPQDPLGWYNLGVILYVKKDINQAGAAFTQAVTLQNDYSNALFMLGLTYYQVGAPEQSIAALTRVAELNPKETSVLAMIENIRSGKAPFDGLSQQGIPAQ